MAITYEQAMQSLRAASSAGTPEGDEAAKKLAVIAFDLKNKQPVTEQTSDTPRTIETEVSDFKEMAGNVPSSGIQAGKDIYNMVRHPIDTASTIRDMGQGLLEKAIPGDYSTEYTQMVDQVGEGISNRYGSLDKARETVINDPVGVALDVGTGGLSATAAALKATNLASKAIPKKLPRNMLADSLRVRPGINIDVKERIIDTMLKEGIRPTTDGIAAAKNVITDINTKIDEIIKNAPDGTFFDRDVVLKYVEKVRSDLTGKVAKGAENQGIIDKMVDDFKAHFDTLKTGDRFTPEELQTFKKNIYQEINWDTNISLPGNATMKSFGKSAREQIETVDPKIKPLNAREGSVIEVMDELPSMATKMANYRSVGMDLGLKTGSGAAIDFATGMPGLGTAMGFLSGIYGHPRVKSNLAYTLEALRNLEQPTQKAFNMTSPAALAALAQQASEMNRDE